MHSPSWFGCPHDSTAVTSMHCMQSVLIHLMYHWEECILQSHGAVFTLHVNKSLSLSLSLSLTHSLTHTHARMHARTHAHTHTHTHRFNGPFPRLTRWAGTRKVKPIWILLKQETVSGSGIVCTSLQTDNHASPRPLSFLQARCPSCRPT